MKENLTLYIHQVPGTEEQVARTLDMSEWPHTFGVVLGTQVIEIEWQRIDRDPTEALIESLEQRRQAAIEECNEKVRCLSDEIDRLRALEYHPDSP
jgi:arginine repressor